MIKLIISTFISSSLIFSSHAQFQDTLFSKQWALKNQGQEILRFTDTNIRGRFSGTTGADINWKSVSSKLDRKVIVAVIDSGIDVTHPDLKGKIWKNPKRCGDDKNTPDCFGVNVLDIESRFDVSDDTGHGTHIAGIIAANHNNMGVAGVLKDNVEIMAIKVLSQNTTDFVYKDKYITEIFAKGIIFAVENGADVINLSLGWPEIINRKPIRNAIRLAVQKNIPIVAAAGNNNKDLPLNPCIFSGVICVGAVDNQGKVTEFSNFGGLVDILAPGESIVSTYPSSLEPAKYVESKILRIHGYEMKKGSSQAAPFVAAIIAALKLENPDISINQIKARLFSNSQNMAKAKNEDKYAKFGLVDMKSTLENEVTHFVTPNFKKLIEVNFDEQTSKFGFNLELDNLLNNIDDLTVEIKSQKNILAFDKDIQTVKNFSAGSSKKLIFKGFIKNQKEDSNVKISVRLISREHQIDQTTSSVIFFSKKISNSPNIRKVVINSSDLKALSKIESKSGPTRLQQVSDPKKLSKNAEYYRYIKSKDESEVTFQFFSFNERSLSTKSQILKISDMKKVLSVFKGDYNLDGEVDYLVYGMNRDKLELVFNYFDKNLNPLWGEQKSRWVFPISSFEGLPLKDGFKENFHWIKHQSPSLGIILVPLIQKVWFLPEQDNTDDFFDELPNRQSRRLYYLEPLFESNKVSVRVRTIESYSFLENIKDRFNLDFDEDIAIDTPFPQLKKEIKRGVVNTNLSAGIGFNRKYYSLKLESTSSYQINQIFTGVSHIENNNKFIFERMDDQQPQKLFVAQLKKNEARVQIKNHNNFEQPLLIKTDSWGDLLANFLVGFENDQSLDMIFESRYYVYHLDSNGNKQKLRVYRDSTISSRQFSEFYTPIKISTNGELKGGLFIDSTMIFGKRVYAMTKQNGVFLRPFGLSLNIPRECMMMNTTEFQEEGPSYAVMQCGTKGKLSDFRIFPIAL